MEPQMQDYLRVGETKTHVPEAALRWGDDVTDAGLPVGDDRSAEDCLEWLRSIRNMYSPVKPSNTNLFSQLGQGLSAIQMAHAAWGGRPTVQ